MSARHHIERGLRGRVVLAVVLALSLGWWVTTTTAAAQPVAGASILDAASVPLPGDAGAVRVLRTATRGELVAALRTASCEPESILVQAGGRWSGYFPGAGVNAGFPASVAAGEAVTVRCTNEIEVRIRNGDVVLAGTLALPHARGPFAAAVLISGSGGQDRDEALEGVNGYRPFEWISDHLTQRGMAVLRYDDRGVAQSTGVQHTATTADLAGDTAAVVAFLEGSPFVDASRVGLIGHSEGGIIAAHVAARQRVAFVVSIAGTAVPGKDLLLLQSRRIAEACGATPEQVAATLDVQRRVVGLVEAGDWTALHAFISALASQQIAALPPEVAATITPTAVASLILMQVENYATWLRYFIADDPADDWARVRAPVLALFGDRDTQVPTDQNRGPLEAALERAGNRDVTVVEFAGANHLMKRASTGCISEYDAPPDEFVPGFLDAIGDWLERRVLR